MNSSYIITFVGDDRPGIVDQLSHTIRTHGGNWQESRLSQLGGKFAGLILVSLPSQHGTALQTDLATLSSATFTVNLTTTGPRPEPAAGRPIALSLLGPDRLGIVREVAHALARLQINVTEMDSKVTPAPMSAEPLFHAQITAWIPAAIDLDELRSAIADVADQMTLEIELT